MKPTDTYTNHRTFDLTECKVHALKNDDGSTRIVARYPKTWTKREPAQMGAINGSVTMSAHDVTEWYEITLQVIPAP